MEDKAAWKSQALGVKPTWVGERWGKKVPNKFAKLGLKKRTDVGGSSEPAHGGGQGQMTLKESKSPGKVQDIQKKKSSTLGRTSIVIKGREK